MIKEAISILIKGEDLETGIMEQVMEEIMTGRASDAQKASFLTALAIKGETVNEITAAARIMGSKCEIFHNDIDALEIVGTGGDKSNTFNISTCAAIVTSAAGIRVAKHGNRAASSRCGTADCLEALGVKIDADVSRSEKVLDEVGMCFLFAQKYHTAMRFVGAVRKDIGIRTMFNILGPLSNPARASMQLLGVFDESLVEQQAHVLKELGLKRVMSVYGMDCMDEISLSAPTKICECREDGNYRTYEITPEQFGLKRCKKEDLVGGEPSENAQIVRDIFNGSKGPKTDAVILNAGAAIYLTHDNMTIKDGIARAREIIESGAAKAQLEKFIAATNC